MTRSSKDPEGRYAQARAAALADFERTFVREVLSETNGHVAEAARVAGMDRLYLHRLMKRHGVTRHAVRVECAEQPSEESELCQS